MRLFRPTYKEKKSGRVKTVRKWWVELRDHFHTVRRFAAFTDKAKYEALGRQIERLVKIGFIDSKRLAAGKLLTAHIADYTVSLLAKGYT